MGVKMTGVESVLEDIRRKIEEIQREMVNKLAEIGDRVVGGICDGSLSNWNDQTGALRSSIGYVVARDGKAVREGGFSAHLGSSEGIEEGRAYANSLAILYPQGIALIIVAGMDYAAYVEKIESKSVLAQGELEAERLVRALIDELNSKSYDSNRH